MAYLVAAQPLGLDAQTSLQLNVVAERLQVLWPCQNKQVAALAQADRLAEVRFERLEHADAGDRESNVDLCSELVAHAPSALAGRALAEELAALQEQDVAQAARG